MTETRVPRYVPRETITPQRIVPAETMGAQVGAEIQKTATQELGTQVNQALEANRYLISGNVAQKMNELYMNAVALNNPEQGLKQFNAGYQGFAEATIANTPTRNQPFARNVLVHASNNAAMRLETQVIKQKKTDAFINAMHTFDQNKQAMYYYNRSGDEAGGHTYHALSNQQIDDMVNTGIITGAAAEKLHNQLRKEMFTSKYVGEFLAAKKYDKANNTNTANEFMRNFPNSQAAEELTDKDILALESIFKKYNLLAKQGAALDSAHYNAKIKEVVYRIRKTGEMPSSRELDMLYEAKPANYDLVQKKISNAKAIYSNVAQVKDLNLGTITGKLALEQQALRDAKTIDQQSIAAASVNDLKNLMQEITANPSQYIETNPSYKKMIQNDLYKDKYTMPELKVFAQKHILGLTDGQVRVQSQAMNLRDIQTIKSLPIDQGLQFLNDQKNTFPKTSNYYLQGIREKKAITGEKAQAGIPSYYFNLMKMQDNPQQRPYVPEAIAAFSIKKNEYSNLMAQIRGTDKNFTPTQLNAHIQGDPDIQNYISAIRANPNIDPLEENAITENIYSVAAYEAINNNKLKLADAVHNAFNHLYGARYSIIKSTYVIPQTMNENSVKNMIDHIDVNISKIIPFQPLTQTVLDRNKGIFSKEQLAQNRIKNLHTGFWVNDKNNDEVFVRHKADGSVVYTPKGFDVFGKHFDRQYLYFTKNDLENSTFQVHSQKMLEQKKALMPGITERFGLLTHKFIFPTRSK